MPRPNPETIMTSTKMDYRNRTTSNTTYYTHTRFRRDWSGSNSAGYPHHIVYNNHSVRKSSASDMGSYHCEWRSPTSPDFAVYDGNCALDVGFPSPSGSPYEFGSISHDATVTQRVINRCIDDIADRKVNLAQFIAERQQVANLVNDTVQKLTRTMRALRRRNFKAALGHLGITSHPRGFSQNLADNWLALQYGWKPLLADVRGAAEHLASNHMGRPLRIKSLQRSQSISPPYVQRVSSGNYGKADWIFSEKITRAQCILEFQVTNDFIRQGQQLGITDPLTLAWELVPYSFVVDWFLPVGDFLSRLNYDSGLTYMGGCHTTTSFQKQSLAPVSESIPFRLGANNYTSTVSGYPLKAEEFKMDRVILVSPPRAVLPSFKDPFSAIHVANALALMRGAFRVR